MANDYIPRPDAWFHAWQNNFVTYVNGHLALPAGVMGESSILSFRKDGAPTRFMRISLAIVGCRKRIQHGLPEAEEGD